MESYIFDTAAPKAEARLPYGTDALQFGDLRLPAGSGPHPVIVVVHGGFWRAKYNLEHLGHMCAALTAEGVATWSIEFRRIGNPGGAWPGTFQDVGQGADYLRQLAPTYNLDLERVIAIGHSAGGHLACWLAARKRIPVSDILGVSDPLAFKGAVSLAGVVNLKQSWQLKLGRGVTEELMGGSPVEYPERYATASPFELLPLALPQVLVHGTEDEEVPFSISQEYCEAAIAKGDPARLLRLPGAGHFELIDPLSKEWPQILEATLALLD